MTWHLVAFIFAFALLVALAFRKRRRPRRTTYIVTNCGSAARPWMLTRGHVERTP